MIKRDYSEIEKGGPIAMADYNLINSGIKKVICEKMYQSGAEDLLQKAGVQIVVLNKELEKY